MYIGKVLLIGANPMQGVDYIYPHFRSKGMVHRTTLRHF